jgi:hypothetical protein
MKRNFPVGDRHIDILYCRLDDNYCLRGGIKLERRMVRCCSFNRFVREVLLERRR